MQKLFKILLILVSVAFVTMQFFHPEKNLGEITINHILIKEKIPENIKAVIQNACLDCHSNQTRYSWYHSISPVSWMVNRHVEEGKKEINFSDWGEMDLFGKIETLEEICQELERKKMPLKSYVMMHKEAKLSDEQVAELCEWTEKLGLELLGKVEN
ncbi:MAG: heme-binding domain-containing protein [Bacteroidetes bacterium]|nr:heme-binding domain-containing protein [Bacteroidota bacterium]